MAAIRSSSRGASASATPNLASGLPVSIAACVSPGTLGFTRTRTRWPAGARRASRSTSSGPSMTIRPTPASRAATRSASRFALPCSSTCAGSNPADRAIASSPADATSQPNPSCARIRITGAHGSALVAKCTSVAGWRDANAARYSRAVARRPSSSMTKTGVPCSAATSASAQPPTARRPSGRRPAVRGRTPARLTPRCPGAASGPRPRRRTRARRRRAAARPAAARAGRRSSTSRRSRPRRRSGTSG